MSEREKGLVSIIVPTQNSDKYLDLCLHCIVNQTYHKIEIIICDGASEDRTNRIIQNYMKEYDYIRCLTLENKGVSHSRNAGIEAAQGEYIEFVDSDDFLQPGACETMVREMERTGADVVIAGFRRMMTRENEQPVPGIYEGPKELLTHLSDYFSAESNYIKPAWNKMYRRESLTARFSEELDLREDILFNIRVLEEASKIAVIPDTVYEYNNGNAIKYKYKYREDGFDLEVMVHKKMIAFVGKFGVSDYTVLYHVFLNLMRIQIIALVHNSGWSENECKKRLQTWMENETVQEMTQNYSPQDRKDRKWIKLLSKCKKSALYRHVKVFYRRLAHGAK